MLKNKLDGVHTGQVFAGQLTLMWESIEHC